MSFKSRVIDVMGDSIDLTESHFGNALNIVEQAVWDVVSVLPAKMLLKHSVAPTAAATYQLDGDERILFVERAVGGDYFGCAEIGFEDSRRALDSESIHLASNFTPVYWVMPDGVGGDIESAPAAGASNFLRIHSYKRQVAGVAATQFDWTLDADGPGVANPSNVPTEAHEAIIYLIASRLLTQQISFMGIEEEDQEALQLTQAAQGAIDGEFKTQIMKLRGEEATEK
jgi:hypothetical protein